jgi:hypothetical protein
VRVSLAGQWFQPHNRRRPRQCELVAICDVMWSVCGQVPAPLTVTVNWYPLAQDGRHFSQARPRNPSSGPWVAATAVSVRWVMPPSDDAQDSAIPRPGSRPETASILRISDIQRRPSRTSPQTDQPTLCRG